MRLFDSHAHLSDERLCEDLPAVLANARAAGVERVLLPASDLADSRAIVKILASEPSMLVGALGVHPHEAKDFAPGQLAELRRLLLQSPGVVALGEIGLDYHYDFSPRALQKEVFRAQMELAAELELPLILHDREAHGDFLTLLQKAAADGLLRKNKAPGVVHCYSGSWELARELLKLGFYLGFDGPITYKNARQSHEVIVKMPRERLVIETDSPYLAPVPHRGKRNEPALVAEVAKKVAELWALAPEEAAELTYRNALDLFAL